MAAVPKDLYIPPKRILNHEMTEAIHRGPLMMRSDCVAVGDTSPVLLFNVPANVFVHEVKTYTTTAWDGSTAATLTIGDSDDADRFMAASDADIQNLYARTSLSAESSDQVGRGGYNYTSAIQIQGTLDNQDASNGALSVYIVYTPYSDEL